MKPTAKSFLLECCQPYEVLDVTTGYEGLLVLTQLC